MNRANSSAAAYAMKAVACILVVALVAGLGLVGCTKTPNGASTTAATTNTTSTTKPTEPAPKWQMGIVATTGTEAGYCDADGNLLGTLKRGQQVEYEIMSDGKIKVRVDDVVGYLQEGASVVFDAADIIPAHTLYVRTTVNLRDVDSKLLEPLAKKGDAVEVTGYDYLCDDGKVHMYQVKLGKDEGYIMPWYLVDTKEEALANYDNGYYAVHSGRLSRYGSGDAKDLDFFPRDKGPIAGNVMPDETRSLYINAWSVGQVDKYIEIAKGTGVNAFVVDIADGNSIGYAGEVMKRVSPSAAKVANYSVESYQAGIKKLKDAGYYVIGRITTFADSKLVKDHKELAISDSKGSPMKLSNEYWPSAYSRTVWQYKVDMAVEAVQLMGFNEIQFDYVRFPTGTWSYEKEGTINFHNTYGETKSQAIQRFLMYAADRLHDEGAYISADVFGESSYAHVTAYGQYWPAISNVVDVISGMPYPDHFSASGDWKPWEHPYTTLYNWAKTVIQRQEETATPAVVRTWIQTHNAIKAPYNKYGPDEVYAQIRGLRDAGITGGYMTWNPRSSLEKYTSFRPILTPPEEKKVG